MKVLHIASFRGNIGDNLSHLGFAKILESLNVIAEIDRVEIRKFYKNYDGVDKCFFDRKFIDTMNRYDLVVIGGGGFFDFWVEGSVTGTTIDMDPDLIKTIKIPTIFASIGSHPHRKVPIGNEDKFKRFFSELVQNENIYVGLRNDGSIKVLQELFGEDVTKWDQVDEILDNAFFCGDGLEERKALYPAPYIAINITSDQLEMASSRRGDINRKDYVHAMSRFIERQAEDFNIVFVPHIYSDLEAIYQVLTALGQSVIRNRVSVAPCVQGDNGSLEALSIYRDSELVVASRFHANVGPLAVGSKVMGLAVLDRVAYLYNSLALNDRYVEVGKNLEAELLTKARKVLAQDFNCGELKVKREESLCFYGNIIS